MCLNKFYFPQSLGLGDGRIPGGHPCRGILAICDMLVIFHFCVEKMQDFSHFLEGYLLFLVFYYTFTLNNHGFRKFCTKLNFLQFSPHLLRLSEYHVFMLNHIIFPCEKNRCDIFTVRLRYHHCSFEGQKKAVSFSFSSSSALQC